MDQVFYISLAGVDNHGRVTKHLQIFDICTKLYDFLGTDVIAVNSQDLLAFATVHGKHNITGIYQLVAYYIEHHNDGHFFIDECPVLRSTSKS